MHDRIREGSSTWSLGGKEKGRVGFDGEKEGGGGQIDGWGVGKKERRSNESIKRKGVFPEAEQTGVK